jgi:hypothetical protein
MACGWGSFDDLESLWVEMGDFVVDCSECDLELVSEALSVLSGEHRGEEVITGNQLSVTARKDRDLYC